jgi:hypothetical protein
MTFWQWLCQAVVAGLLVRQLVVTAAVIRSTRFLGQPPYALPGRGDHQESVLDHGVEQGTLFFVVLPVLREAAVIAEAVAHFETLAQRHSAQVIVVTTQREAVQASTGGNDRADDRANDGGVRGRADTSTIALAQQLARVGKVIHLHYPDPDGLKADQLNFAAQYCAATLLGEVRAERAFVVCYDADSRPPLDSLDRFADAVAAHGDADVFHQSSRFELRTPLTARRRIVRAALSRGLGEGAALRANRFVLGFEIPRLINRSPTNRSPTNRPTGLRVLRRRLCSYVYAHVTGHGLCVRLSLLLALPFPARSPLEDMHYSFYLGSRNLPMVAVPSLDRAEVPATVGGQVGQAARWFFGPARFLRYLRDPATQPGRRAMLMAASACGSAVEWLGCAVVPTATALLTAAGPDLIRATAAAVAGIYITQLLATDAAIGARAPWPRRLIRVLWCPVATTLFGIGGFLGMVRLLKGGSGVGKTERR